MKIFVQFLKVFFCQFGIMQKKKKDKHKYRRQRGTMEHAEHKSFSESSGKSSTLPPSRSGYTSDAELCG